jgi:2-keto-4-pentenoate hydratase/2-oxohepta-3-ene-1,7-dioic acid hydratase in catechol pathway
MRLASFRYGGRESYGIVAGDGIIDLRPRLPRYRTLMEMLREGGLEEAKASSGARPDIALSKAALLPPIPAPEKIICVATNYAERGAESKDRAKPALYPTLFMRVPGSFAGHDQSILRPKESTQFDYEGEIALIIGREGRRIERTQALDHVAGITLCNEGTMRDWTHHGKLNVTQGKNFDKSGSLGPWMVTRDGIDLSLPLHLTTTVNGEIRQDDTTTNLIFSFARLIAYISTFMTLKAGDVIVTGTPAGTGACFDPPRWLAPGDVIEIEVPEIGVLRNIVVADS